MVRKSLADRHPKAKLLPDDPKVRALAGSYSAEMHSAFPDVRGHLTMEFAREIPTPQLRDATKAQIERIKAAWSDALGEYGKDGGFLFGRFSIADCMYAPVVSRFRTYGISLSPALQAYSDRIWALPAMKEWGKAAKAEVDAGLA
jgi:glutathione S-transferase